MRSFWLRKVSVTFDHYYLYDELTDLLHQYAAAYPEFVQLESVGKSYEGRDVWAVTITNSATGPADNKPAMYIDGNIHAGEVTGSVAAVYLIDYLLANYETDPKVKKLLDTRTFYILPRVNPDGAELYLTTPAVLRSSVRIFPEWRKTEDPPGLHPEDVDGNGEIMLMRIRDDARGAWKVASEDSRLLIERTPVDLEGPFYHVFTEGMLRDEHGHLAEKVQFPFEIIPVKHGLDLNRNFPAGYSPLTAGSGPFPLSEPETRNQVEFISKHKNIAGVLLYHTTGGVLFRPHSTISDKQLPREDVAMYEAIGKLGTDVTGYPTVCCYGDVWSGVLDDWCYEQLGLFAFTPELWDATGRAAPEFKNKMPWDMSADEKRKLELKLLEWNDRELAGQGFRRWTRVQHPQFGEVEIGGWHVKECRQNPPRHLLEPECYNITQFSLNYALALPEVHIDEVHVEQVAEGVFSLQVVVSNHGYLPTNISRMALKQKSLRQDILRLDLAQGMQLINGDNQQEIGHLEGYASGQQNWFYFYAPPAKGVRRVRWTIGVGQTAKRELTVKLISERGGLVERFISL